MPLFRRRNKAGAPHGPVVEVNPHADLPRIPGVPLPGSPPPRSPSTGIPGTSSFFPPSQGQTPKPRSYNDNMSAEHLKAPSKEFVGYTNRQVGEAKDNAIDNINRFGGQLNNDSIIDALKRLNGR